MTSASLRSPGWRTAVDVLAWCALAVSGVACAVLLAQQVLDFGRDAQYYVQAALLWPQGQVGFAGSLVGGRDLVVFAYFAAMRILGENLDALAICVALFFSLCAVALIAVMASVTGFNWRAAVAAMGAVAAASSLPAWAYPATDGPGVALLAILWAIWAAWLRTRRAALCWLALPLTVGISLHVRSELILFGLLLGICLGWMVLVSRPTVPSGGRNLVRVALAMLAFVSGNMLAGLVWPLWVGTEKPHVYSYIFPTYRAFDVLAAGRNGPASARLASMLDLEDETRLPFWQALGRSYIEVGARESDRIMGKAALEGLRAEPVRFVSVVGRTLCGEFCSTDSLLPRLIVEHGTLQKRIEQRDAMLRDLDHMRMTHSAQFGNDPYTDTARLALGGVPGVGTARRNLGGLEYQLQMPMLATPVAAVALFLVALLGGLRPLLLPVAIYALSVWILVALTQGAVVRYLDGALLLCVSGLLVACSAAKGRTCVTTVGGAQGKRL